MIGDKKRRDTAQSTIESRKSRCQKFPIELFSEYGWELLLQTFIAHIDNEMISEVRLFEIVGIPDIVGDSWLKHLVTVDQIERHGNGADVQLTRHSITAMRDYLDSISTVDPKITVNN